MADGSGPSGVTVGAAAIAGAGTTGAPTFTAGPGGCSAAAGAAPVLVGVPFPSCAVGPAPGVGDGETAGVVGGVDAGGVDTGGVDTGAAGAGRVTGGSGRAAVGVVVAAGVVVVVAAGVGVAVGVVVVVPAGTRLSA